MRTTFAVVNHTSRGRLVRAIGLIATSPYGSTEIDALLRARLAERHLINRVCRPGMVIGKLLQVRVIQDAFPRLVVVCSWNVFVLLTLVEPGW